MHRESSADQQFPKAHFTPKAAEEPRTLFLGDLSVICDEIKLYDLFSHFGVVETVQLKKSDLREPT